MAPTRREKFDRAVYQAVREVQHGEVTTYGAIAKALGADNYSRHVGVSLSRCPKTGVPWWRVINSSGRVSFRPKDTAGEGTRKHPYCSKQRKLLEKEGHEFSSAGTIVGWTAKLHNHSE